MKTNVDKAIINVHQLLKSFKSTQMQAPLKISREWPTILNFTSIVTPFSCYLVGTSSHTKSGEYDPQFH